MAAGKSKTLGKDQNRHYAEGAIHMVPLSGNFQKTGKTRRQRSFTPTGRQTTKDNHINIERSPK
jgi:hypothetical protein